MNIFVVPSWYPSKDAPYTGIFVKEQALALASLHSTNNIGISTWGSHLNSLLLEKREIHQLMARVYHGRKLQANDAQFFENCVQYFSPAFTWSRSILKGNIKGIIQANEQNLKRFTAKFGAPDVLHAHTAYPGGYVAMALSQKHGIPFVITEHMSPFPFKTFDDHGKLHPVIKEAYHHSCKNIAVSQTLRKTMEQKGVPNLVVINNLTDELFFSPSQLHKPHSTIRHFAFIGRMEDQKGVKYLLEAAAGLKKSGQLFRLTMGGDGPLMENLQQLAEKLDIKAEVSWLGRLSREEVKATLQTCDAFVLPSLHENHPLVLLEAMAMGKPIIATRCGGSEEIVATQAGVIVEPGNAAMLAEAMKAMIEGSKQYSSDAIRQHFLDHFSRKVIIQQLESVYMAAASGKLRSNIVS